MGSPLCGRCCCPNGRTSTVAPRAAAPTGAVPTGASLAGDSSYGRCARRRLPCEWQLLRALCPHAPPLRAGTVPEGGASSGTPLWTPPLQVPAMLAGDRAC
ncbi:hypothetical protein B296_00039511 [Ensete ventricosum]|uniref:Uncharacterized protein n=1 Tax=Ensete ventricosum TaxID=4639 RepID=A0A426WWC0_ENSVE|nr:hypothetical protein B296_00039511 [Ensete ventricosum]